MSWDVPTAWQFVLFALAAYRTFHLLAEDTILDRSRAALVRRLGQKFDEFLLCPWCCGAWVSIAWWLAWVLSHHWATVVAVPWAISAVVALIAVNLDRD